MAAVIHVVIMQSCFSPRRCKRDLVVRPLTRDGFAAHEVIGKADGTDATGFLNLADVRYFVGLFTISLIYRMQR